MHPLEMKELYVAKVLKTVKSLELVKTFFFSRAGDLLIGLRWGGSQGSLQEKDGMASTPSRSF